MRAITVLVALCVGWSAAFAEVPIRVSGFGWIRDREMRGALKRLTGADKAASLDANGVEDAAVILTSALNQDGFQEPKIDIEAKLSDGTVKRFEFDPTFATPVPRPMEVHELTFHVRRGVRWRVDRVRIEGLNAIPEEDGRGYFRTDATLLTISRTNAYSKPQLDRSEGALLDELRRRGYAEATVRAEVARVARASGDVAVNVTVREGPKWIIEEMEIAHGETPGVTLPSTKPWIGATWTPSLEQDIREEIRLAFYRAGYPDVRLQMETDADDPVNGQRNVFVAVTVTPGLHVTAGEAHFSGNDVTKDSVLKRRVRVKPGDPLNPIALEHARHRISRLGVFQSVELQYEPTDGVVRDPLFIVKEGPRYETNLLFGYGSYEEFRVGVEYRQMNIFGLAHQSRLLLIQSVKSTRGEYMYTVPELLGEAVDGTATLFGLQRKEIAFVRQEYGATFGLRRAIRSLGGEATLGYTFEALRNTRSGLVTEPTDQRQLNVAHVDFGLTTNRLDNTLRPRRGYHANVRLELASRILGGVAQYQRTELGGAYHTPWGRSRWIHVGLSHGFITTMGADDDRNLPVNKRFYPGGDSSIRGYTLGEASPRTPDGRFVGAKSYLLLNVELEQALTPTWSVVAFTDALGNATTWRDYPFRERLYSVGLGIRYQTIVGPIRLEYGRNVNPRPADPSGTWHLSIGYPF